MVQDPTMLLKELSGTPFRRYSTFDFGRMRDEQCASVIVPEANARPLIVTMRKQLPPGFVTFVGTTRWFGDERHDAGAEIVVGRGESQFDILRLARSDACNYNMGTDDLIKKLQSWHQFCGIDIFHAETDTVELTLERLPPDIRAFANEVYEFCPDTVDQGVGSVDVLEKTIKDHKQIFLWWD